MIRDDDFFIMINGSRGETLRFTLPDVPGDTVKRVWFQIIDTAAAAPDDFVDNGAHPPLDGGDCLAVLPQSIVVLRSNALK